MKRRLIATNLGLAVVLGAAGCASRVDVVQYGRMHDVLSGGAAQARGLVELDEVLERPHAFGVGALASLEGEITIIDGQAAVARASSTGLLVSEPAPTEHAALLTLAYVENWDTSPIESDLQAAELEQFVFAQAREAGMDTDKPFPFLLEGDLTDLEMHVIRGECPMRPGVKLAADQQPWQFSLDQPTAGRIVGFYAADSVGDMTHPGTSIHAHALLKLEGRQVTGHVERLAIARGGVLKLPSRTR